MSIEDQTKPDLEKGKTLENNSAPLENEVNFEQLKNQIEDEEKKEIEEFVSGDKEASLEIEKSVGIENTEVISEIKKEIDFDNKLDDLNNQAKELKSNELENINFEPLPEENAEEYIDRMSRDIVSDYVDNNEDIASLNRLIKKAYYSRHANQAIVGFFKEENNVNKFTNIFSELDKNNDKKYSIQKNKEVENVLLKKISSSNRSFGQGEDHEKVDYYANTNQTREFFSQGRKHDSLPYSLMMFGLPEEFTKTEEGRKYVHEIIDEKVIFLFGGGDSIKDLLVSEEYHPEKVINFDPFVKSETIDKNKNGIYESLSISASDENITSMVEKNELPKADEVWATYSVPFYLDSPKEIESLINNMSSVLKEGGNARISPISVQNDGDLFEERKQVLVSSIQDLIKSDDFNVSIFGNTLKIHRIKKEIKE